MSANSMQVRFYINKIVAYAKKHLPEEQHELVAKYLHFYFAYLSPEDFSSKTIADLYGLAMSHWEIIRYRQENQVKVQVFNPQSEKDKWQSKHTIINVISNDMPFLVDSLCMEINKMGITIHLVISTGGLKVKRDNKGLLIDVLPYDALAENTLLESPIFIEVDRVISEKNLQEIHDRLMAVLMDVNAAVADWKPMCERMRMILGQMEQRYLQQKKTVIKESMAFLEWLLNDNFTFIGARDYDVVADNGMHALRLRENSSLGVLRDVSHSKIYREFSDLPEGVREKMLSKEQIVVISETNTLSTVHRRAYTYGIDVKLYNTANEFVGVSRFIGLYTSGVYSSSPLAIPFLRRKVLAILKKSGLPRKSHSGKDLIHILTNLPRDDLFQASASELYELAINILNIQERRQVRLFVRQDIYKRFFSCLVYMPRENFTTDLSDRIRDILMQEFSGLEANFNIHFSESMLARVHYIIRVDPKKEIIYDTVNIEKKVIAVSQSWEDGLREHILGRFSEEEGNHLLVKYKYAFPAGYREMFQPRNAIYDLEHIEALHDENDLGMSLYRPLDAPRDVMKLKLYRRKETVPLSDALPILENMGMRVIAEASYQLRIGKTEEVWINDFSMTYATEMNFELADVKEIFQEAFKIIWQEHAENDGFNRLVLQAQLNWREISVLRAYTKYLWQTSFTFSAQYTAIALVNNPDIAQGLVKLFKYKFDPAMLEKRQEKMQEVEAIILKKLDDVASLDEDRILRRFLAVIHATLRTNYFQKTKGQYKSQFSFKFDSKKIPELPLPVPLYEIFVYSPRFEGIHLRSGKIARGGIRLSDRPEDYRVEILGLMKTQQVKNALIVPAGAKGGFVPKKILLETDREKVMQERIETYQDFIRGLLDVTDNLNEDQVISPADTVCYDEADPYLVVAADKGTATFSDIANQIALERNFWLGDAFASGGATGYDHKKMAITARGAWVSVERHFQELGINVDQSNITVVGVGDMLGDVFGNGLLMSPYLKLIGAFNHQHIFFDPDPDPAISYEERKRLFALPRSTWEDYNKELISKGGGVFSRQRKSIPINAEMQQLLNISADSLVPNEFIKALLRAPVDLIWNGGIGTFVKSSKETHADTGDRSNDGIRINGNELRARAVCEGGNLGMTQLARIEYELNEGKVNTDFIDNSGGVDCSDHEVNIKILLNSIMNAGDLTYKQRNQLLANMSNEVAELVLQNNYHQNQAISLAAHFSFKHMNTYMRYIHALEENGKLDRALEFLPDDKTILDRKSSGIGLTRPELAVLLAYTKIVLDERIRESELSREPYLASFVKNAFPSPLRKRYEKQLLNHRLHNQIVSTQISNQLVSEMGITFAYRMYDETGASIPAIVRAYTVAREIFAMPQTFADIEELDYIVDVGVQIRMYDKVISLVRRASRWLLRAYREKIEISDTIARFSSGVNLLYRRLPRLLVGREKQATEEQRDTLIAANVPEKLAIRIANSEEIYHALNIIEVAAIVKADLFHVAHVYFILVEWLDLIWFRDLIDSYTMDDRWSVLAKAAYKSDLDEIQRMLTRSVMTLPLSEKISMKVRVQTWMDRCRELIDRWQKVVANLRSFEGKDFAILAVAIRELSDLAQQSSHLIEDQGPKGG